MYGFELASKAGFNFEHFSASFELLDMMRAKSVGYSVWSSHPTAEARAKNISQKTHFSKNRTFVKQSQESIAIQEQQFLALKEEMLSISIEALLRTKQYELAHRLSDKAIIQFPDSYSLHYYVGESSRRKAVEPQAHLKEYACLLYTSPSPRDS